MTVQHRVKKLEKIMIIPETRPPMVRIILKDDESQEAGIQRWMKENDTNKQPKDIIFRTIIDPT